MEYSFVSYLGTDSFLPGVLVLNASIKKHNEKYGLLVLVTDLVSANSIGALAAHQIKYKLVEQIRNPNHLINDDRNFKHMYTKLRIFELYEYDKVVYIDSDMLVCANIEELFEYPHLSAVIAGALYPGNESWKELNAGLLIIEPDRTLTERLYTAINSTPSGDGSDQGFLHSFYTDWPLNEHLHLDQRFNVPAGYIDEYCLYHGFRFSYKNRKLDTDIAIIHYWGREKPWDIPLNRSLRNSEAIYIQSIVLWWDEFMMANRGNRGGKARGDNKFLKSLKRLFNK